MNLGHGHLLMYFTVTARIRGWESSSPQTIQIFCQQAQDPVVTLTPAHLGLLQLNRQIQLRIYPTNSFLKARQQGTRPMTFQTRN